MYKYSKKLGFVCKLEQNYWISLTRLHNQNDKILNSIFVAMPVTSILCKIHQLGLYLYSKHAISSIE